MPKKATVSIVQKPKRNVSKQSESNEDKETNVSEENHPKSTTDENPPKNITDESPQEESSSSALVSEPNLEKPQETVMKVNR